MRATVSGMENGSLLRLLLWSAFAFLFATSGHAQERSNEIILRLSDVSLNKLPFVVAYEEGIYAENGLNVIPKFSPGAVAVVRRSGINVPDRFIFEEGTEYSVGVSGTSPTIVGIASRAGAAPGPIILASTHHKSRWRISAGPDITSAEDLKGKRIGYSGYGSVTHLMSIQFAKAMGWDPRFDVSLMSNGLAVEAMEKGSIDAMVGDDIHTTMALNKGFHVVVQLADYDLPVAGSGLMADREWVKNNPDLARAFVKTAVDAIHKVKADKQATFRTLRKWYGMQDVDVMEAFYARAETLPRKPFPPYEGIKKVMEVYDSHEMRKYTPEYFYDDSFITELDESGYIDRLYSD